MEASLRNQGAARTEPSMHALALCLPLSLMTFAHCSLRTLAGCSGVDLGRGTGNPRVPES